MRAPGVASPRIYRVWAMPAADTFDCPPLGDLVRRYLRDARVSVDPFARNKRWATHTNDLNPETAAEHHMDAVTFLAGLRGRVMPDLFIIDPPYSPRQVKEVYDSVGLSVGMQDTQTARLYGRIRDEVNELATDGAVAIWLGWSSVGMGAPWDLIEMLCVCHGGAHNDTIATVWRLAHKPASLFDSPSGPS